MSKFIKIQGTILVLLCGVLAGACSPLAKSKSQVQAKSERQKDLNDDARSCDFEFKGLGLCASLTRVSGQSVDDPTAQIYFQLRFWNPTDHSGQARYVDPGLDAVLSPRRCPRCRSSFKAELETPQGDLANGDSGPVFRVIPWFDRPGEYNMIIELRKNDQVIDEASVKMDISVSSQ